MNAKEWMPAGFVPLARWDHRHRGGNDGHSPEYKALRAAADAGEIPAIQIGGSGRWFVSESHATEYLSAESGDQSQSDKRSRKAIDGGHAEALTATVFAIAANQASMGDAMKRMSDALESIAARWGNDGNANR